MEIQTSYKEETRTKEAASFPQSKLDYSPVATGEYLP
jgi:hypothetical protein